MEQSGYYGMANGVSSFERWSIDDGTPNLPKNHSGTAYGTKREPGVNSWSGSLEAAGHTPPAFPGDIFAFQGYKNPDSSGDTANGDIWSGNVLVTSMSLVWNFATNEILKYTLTFEGDGALSKTTGALLTDSNPPRRFRPCDGKIVAMADLDDLADETVLAHIAQATLTLNWPGVSTVNSGTSAGSGKCQTQRSKGPALDWNLALVSEEGNIPTIYNEGVQLGFRCYVNASEYWELLYGVFGARTGLVVDRETAAIQQVTHTAEMDSHRNNVAGTKGSVTSPGATAGNVW